MEEIEYYDFEYNDYVKSMERMIIELERRNRTWDGVLVLMRGGFFPAYMISSYFKLPMKYLEISSYKKEFEQDEFTIGHVPEISNGRWLVCDDIYDTGNTMEKVKNLYVDEIFKRKENLQLDFCFVFTKQIRKDITYTRYIKSNIWVNFHWDNDVP